MLLSVLLFVHVCGATIGLLAGFLTIALRKGSGAHAAAGTVFFVAMLTMSTSAAYIAAFLKPIPINVVVSLLTFYLVITGWFAGRRRSGGTNRLDVAAMILAFATGAAGLNYGIQAILHPETATPGVPVVMYFLFGTIPVLLAISDVRMLLRGGVTGARRIGRHLWRMSLALMIATFSLYPGRPRVFPEAWRASHMLYIPHVLLVGVVLIYLVRNGRQRRAQRVRKLELSRAETIVGTAVRA